MSLSIRHLKLVEEVARAGTLTGAARRLFLTQSALSHQLADLEKQAGARVFMRSGRKMIPTAAGRRILEAANATLDELRTLEDDLKRLREGKEGELRITTRCHTAYYWLPRVLPEFRRRHPRIDFRIVPDVSPSPLEALIAGDIDVALDFDVEATDLFLSVPLFNDEFVLIVAPDSPWAQRSFIAPADFGDMDLLVYQKHNQRSFLNERVLVPNDVTPRSVTEIRITEGIVALVTAGVGVSAVSRWSVLPHIESGAVAEVRITEFGLWRNWCAVALRSAEDRRFVVDFIGLMERGPEWMLQRASTAKQAAGA